MLITLNNNVYKNIINPVQYTIMIIRSIQMKLYWYMKATQFQVIFTM